MFVLYTSPFPTLLFILKHVRRAERPSGPSKDVQHPTSGVERTVQPGPKLSGSPVSTVQFGPHLSVHPIPISNPVSSSTREATMRFRLAVDATSVKFHLDAGVQPMEYLGNIPLISPACVGPWL